MDNIWSERLDFPSFLPSLPCVRHPPLEVRPGRREVLVEEVAHGRLELRAQVLEGAHHAGAGALALRAGQLLADDVGELEADGERGDAQNNNLSYRLFVSTIFPYVHKKNRFSVSD